MNNFKILLLAALLAVLLFPLLGPSTTLAGSDITFVHEGTSQGFTLGDEAFPGPYDFIITAVGDIGDREEAPLGNGWSIAHTSAMIEIIGVGTFGVLTPTRTFVNNIAQAVGFSRSRDIGGGDLFDGPIDPIFGDWEMTTSIGPIHGDNGFLLQWNREPFIETTGGRLIFDDEEDVPVTFTAVVVPVGPAPLALLPLAVLLAPRRRRPA